MSELLQAQLLQPAGPNPVQPSLAFPDLVAVGPNGTCIVRRVHATVCPQRRGADRLGLVGSNWTRADELVATGLVGRGVVSAGQYHFHTDGWRQNAELEHDIYDLFGQFDVNEALSVQAEYRGRNTDQGDVTLRFDPDSGSPEQRRKTDQDVGRLGGPLHTGPALDVPGFPDRR